MCVKCAAIINCCLALLQIIFRESMRKNSKIIYMHFVESPCSQCGDCDSRGPLGTKKAETVAFCDLGYTYSPVL